MKKILSLILALVLCLSLCACSVSNKDVAGIYDGSYSHKGDDYEQTFFLEEDGTYKSFLIKNGELHSEETGHYEIHGKEVQLHFEDGYTPFEYKDGKLTSPSSSYQQREYLKVNKGEDAYSAYINRNYTTYLAGKVFESEGRTLTFDDNFCVTYQNGPSGEYVYTYSIEEFVVDTFEITMQIKLKEANRYDEIIDENELEEMTYNIFADNISYYIGTYDRAY